MEGEGGRQPDSSNMMAFFPKDNFLKVKLIEIEGQMVVSGAERWGNEERLIKGTNFQL